MATLTLDLRDGERLLGHGECSRLVGPLSVPGELYLTTARLYFEPDRLNKLVGIKALVINLSDITDAEVSGIDRVMTVTTGAKRARFMGKWARTVYERLESLVSEESGEDRQCWRHRGAALASHESLLVQSTLDYSATSVVMVPGELVVTPRTVSYTPRRLERLVWRNLEFEAPMDQIEELVLDGPRRVSFKVGDKEHRFNGVGSLEVYAAIWAAQDHPGGDVVYVRGQPATGLSTGPGHLVFKFGPVQVHRGVLAHPGLLIQTWRGLAFLLGGSLDKFIGLPQITRFDWPDVVRLDLSSDTRLVISTAMGDGVFSAPWIEKRFDNFLAELSRIDEEDPRVLGLARDPTTQAKEGKEVTEVTEGLVEAWGGRLPDLHGQRLALWGPCMRVSSKLGWLRGHLGLYDDYVIWIPAGGPQMGLNPTVLPVEKLQLPDGPEADPRDLRLKLLQGELLLRAPPQEAFAVRFWKLVAERSKETVKRRKKRGKEEPQPDTWNRRTTYRVGILPVSSRPLVSLQGSGAEGVVEGRLADVSLGGMGIVVQEEDVQGSPLQELGTTVILTVVLRTDEEDEEEELVYKEPEEEEEEETPEEIILTFAGTLMHSMPLGEGKQRKLGISFEDLEATDLSELKQLWTHYQRIELKQRREMD